MTTSSLSPPISQRGWLDVLGRFQRFAKYTDDQLNDMIDAYDRLVIDSACKVV